MFLSFMFLLCLQIEMIISEAITKYYSIYNWKKRVKLYIMNPNLLCN